MNKNDVIQWTEALSDKQLIEFFYEATKGRFIYRGEESYMQSHLVISNASRLKKDNDVWEEWSLASIGEHDPKKYLNSWADDSPICQSGRCCGYEIISWAKNVVCPICGKEVYAT
jgi:hypothetical protein